jgi:2-(1,2-epoxy-1,2-dihydrophenyl)acetyl-CoA isomerase
VAGENAVFSQSFGNIGLATDMGSLYLLPRRVGVHRAKELAMTGRPLNADEALQIGAADIVAPSAELDATARGVATMLAERSPLALAAMKRGFREAEGMTFRESLALEARLQMPQFASRDLQDAATAFLEKQPVRFHGR